MMDCKLEIFTIWTLLSERDGEWGLQVHLWDGHQEEVDPPQQQPHHAGHQGEAIIHIKFYWDIL